MEQEKGWTGKIVTCDLCSNTWNAVYHISCDRLECPNCENMVYFETKEFNEQ